MLVTPGSQRDAVIDRQLAITLASIAGGINAAAFYAVGFFSANMTGNVSALSDRIATGALSSAWLYLVIVIAFIAGAATCTFVILAAERRGVVGAHALVILLEGLLLAPLSLVDLWLAGTVRVALLVIWLAFLMGMQNAVVTHLSNARVRTTHVSGMATDLGIEIALAWKLRGDANPNASGNDTRLRLHLTTIVAFLVGGVAGVVLYQFCGGYALLVASALLCMLGLRGIVSARARSRLA
ncbi:DUF1275 domain-containing protein [Rhizobium sp. KVB221]|uniref:DUF1275 domain-containing protein n=1 Tax=Rhizobium setariae TaxID=2801340 RepID=A0A936YSD5_9HYPH|nr:YoaK family protein [Rhizobium setariae]MBL0373937.1 DUF1275 domain-containing protein [Rhizobium setariae]